MDADQARLRLEQMLGVLRRCARWIFMCFVLATAAACHCSSHVAG